jgi:GNAT superfamily N-acetyltransferase
MQRTAIANPLRIPPAVSGAWLSRRWYYTPRTHRAYSVRQISPGDRRLLAEFALGLGKSTADRDLPFVRELSDMLFDRVIAAGCDTAVGFAALEGTSAGDRIVGVAAYAPASGDFARFSIAVAGGFREEQLGRNLLSTLLRHARRVGMPSLVGVMHWSNRPMQMLGMSMGFSVEAEARDRNLRRLTLSLR